MVVSSLQLLGLLVKLGDDELEVSVTILSGVTVGLTLFKHHVAL